MSFDKPDLSNLKLESDFRNDFGADQNSYLFSTALARVSPEVDGDDDDKEPNKLRVGSKIILPGTITDPEGQLQPITLTVEKIEESSIIVRDPYGVLITGTFAGGIITIGRAKGSDIQFDSSYMSASQAVIEKREKGIFFRNAPGATNQGRVVPPSGNDAANGLSDPALSERVSQAEALLRAPEGTLVGMGDTGSRFRLQRQRDSETLRWYVVDTHKAGVMRNNVRIYPRVTHKSLETAQRQGVDRYGHDQLKDQINKVLNKTAGSNSRFKPDSKKQLFFDVNNTSATILVKWVASPIGPNAEAKASEAKTDQQETRTGAGDTDRTDETGGRPRIITQPLSDGVTVMLGGEFRVKVHIDRSTTPPYFVVAYENSDGQTVRTDRTRFLWLGRKHQTDMPGSVAEEQGVLQLGEDNEVIYSDLGLTRGSTIVPAITDVSIARSQDNDDGRPGSQSGFLKKPALLQTGVKAKKIDYALWERAVRDPKTRIYEVEDGDRITLGRSNIELKIQTGIADGERDLLVQYMDPRGDERSGFLEGNVIYLGGDAQENTPDSVSPMQAVITIDEGKIIYKDLDPENPSTVRDSNRTLRQPLPAAAPQTAPAPFLLQAPEGNLIGMGDKNSRFKLQLQNGRWYVVDQKAKPEARDGVILYPRVVTKKNSGPEATEYVLIYWDGNKEEIEKASDQWFAINASLEQLTTATKGRLKTSAEGELYFEVNEKNAGILGQWFFNPISGGSGEDEPVKSNAPSIEIDKWLLAAKNPAVKTFEVEDGGSITLGSKIKATVRLDNSQERPRLIVTYQNSDGSGRSETLSGEIIPLGRLAQKNMPSAVGDVHGLLEINRGRIIYKHLDPEKRSVVRNIAGKIAKPSSTPDAVPPPRLDKIDLNALPKRIVLHLDKSSWPDPVFTVDVTEDNGQKKVRYLLSEDRGGWLKAKFPQWKSDGIQLTELPPEFFTHPEEMDLGDGIYYDRELYVKGNISDDPGSFQDGVIACRYRLAEVSEELYGWRSHLTYLPEGTKDGTHAERVRNTLKTRLENAGVDTKELQSSSHLAPYARGSGMDNKWVEIDADRFPLDASQRANSIESEQTALVRAGNSLDADLTKFGGNIIGKSIELSVGRKIQFADGHYITIEEPNKYGFRLTIHDRETIMDKSGESYEISSESLQNQDSKNSPPWKLRNLRSVQRFLAVRNLKLALAEDGKTLQLTAMGIPAVPLAGDFDGKTLAAKPDGVLITLFVNEAQPPEGLPASELRRLTPLSYQDSNRYDELPAVAYKNKSELRSGESIHFDDGGRIGLVRDSKSTYRVTLHENGETVEYTIIIGQASEANRKVADFLQRRNIKPHWDSKKFELRLLGTDFTPGWVTNSPSVGETLRTKTPWPQAILLKNDVRYNLIGVTGSGPVYKFDQGYYYQNNKRDGQAACAKDIIQAHGALGIETPYSAADNLRLQNFPEGFFDAPAYYAELSLEGGVRFTLAYDYTTGHAVPYYEVDPSSLQEDFSLKRIFKSTAIHKSLKLAGVNLEGLENIRFPIIDARRIPPELTTPPSLELEKKYQIDSEQTLHFADGARATIERTDPDNLAFDITIVENGEERILTDAHTYAVTLADNDATKTVNDFFQRRNIKTGWENRQLTLTPGENFTPALITPSEENRMIVGTRPAEPRALAQLGQARLNADSSRPISVQDFQDVMPQEIYIRKNRTWIYLTYTPGKEDRGSADIDIPKYTVPLQKEFAGFSFLTPDQLPPEVFTQLSKITLSNGVVCRRRVDIDGETITSSYFIDRSTPGAKLALKFALGGTEVNIKGIEDSLNVPIDASRFPPELINAPLATQNYMRQRSTWETGPLARLAEYPSITLEDFGHITDVAFDKLKSAKEIVLGTSGISLERKGGKFNVITDENFQRTYPKKDAARARIMEVLGDFCGKVEYNPGAILNPWRGDGHVSLASLEESYTELQKLLPPSEAEDTPSNAAARQIQAGATTDVQNLTAGQGKAEIIKLTQGDRIIVAGSAINEMDIPHLAPPILMVVGITSGENGHIKLRDNFGKYHEISRSARSIGGETADIQYGDLRVSANAGTIENIGGDFFLVKNPQADNPARVLDVKGAEKTGSAIIPASAVQQSERGPLQWAADLVSSRARGEKYPEIIPLGDSGLYLQRERVGALKYQYVVCETTPKDAKSFDSKLEKASPLLEMLIDGAKLKAGRIVINADDVIYPREFRLGGMILTREDGLFKYEYRVSELTEDFEHSKTIDGVAAALNEQNIETYKVYKRHAEDDYAYIELNDSLSNWIQENIFTRPSGVALNSSNPAIETIQESQLTVRQSELGGNAVPNEAAFHRITSKANSASPVKPDTRIKVGKYNIVVTNLAEEQGRPSSVQVRYEADGKTEFVDGAYIYIGENEISLAPVNDPLAIIGREGTITHFAQAEIQLPRHDRTQRWPDKLILSKDIQYNKQAIGSRNFFTFDLDHFMAARNIDYDEIEEYKNEIHSVLERAGIRPPEEADGNLYRANIPEGFCELPESYKSGPSLQPRINSSNKHVYFDMVTVWENGVFRNEYHLVKGGGGYNGYSQLPWTRWGQNGALYKALEQIGVNVAHLDKNDLSSMTVIREEDMPADLLKQVQRTSLEPLYKFPDSKGGELVLSPSQRTMPAPQAASSVKYTTPFEASKIPILNEQRFLEVTQGWPKKIILSPKVEYDLEYDEKASQAIYRLNSKRLKDAEVDAMAAQATAGMRQIAFVPDYLALAFEANDLVLPADRNEWDPSQIPDEFFKKQLDPVLLDQIKTAEANGDVISVQWERPTAVAADDNALSAAEGEILAKMITPQRLAADDAASRFASGATPDEIAQIIKLWPKRLIVSSLVQYELVLDADGGRPAYVLDQHVLNHNVDPSTHDGQVIVNAFRARGLKLPRDYKIIVRGKLLWHFDEIPDEFFLGQVKLADLRAVQLNGGSDVMPTAIAPLTETAPAAEGYAGVLPDIVEISKNVRMARKPYGRFNSFSYAVEICKNPDAVDPLWNSTAPQGVLERALNEAGIDDYRVVDGSTADSANIDVTETAVRRILQQRIDAGTVTPNTQAALAKIRGQQLQAEVDAALARDALKRVSDAAFGEKPGPARTVLERDMRQYRLKSVAEDIRIAFGKRNQPGEAADAAAEGINEADLRQAENLLSMAAEDPGADHLAEQAFDILRRALPKPALPAASAGPVNPQSSTLPLLLQAPEGTRIRMSGNDNRLMLQLQGNRWCVVDTDAEYTMRAGVMDPIFPLAALEEAEAAIRNSSPAIQSRMRLEGGQYYLEMDEEAARLLEKSMIGPAGASGEDSDGRQSDGPESKTLDLRTNSAARAWQQLEIALMDYPPILPDGVGSIDGFAELQRARIKRARSAIDFYLAEMQRLERPIHNKRALGRLRQFLDLALRTPDQPGLVANYLRQGLEIAHNLGMAESIEMPIANNELGFFARQRLPTYMLAAAEELLNMALSEVVEKAGEKIKLSDKQRLRLWQTGLEFFDAAEEIRNNGSVPGINLLNHYDKSQLRLGTDDTGIRKYLHTYLTYCLGRDRSLNADYSDYAFVQVGNNAYKTAPIQGDLANAVSRRILVKEKSPSAAPPINQLAGVSPDDFQQMVQAHDELVQNGSKKKAGSTVQSNDSDNRDVEPGDTLIPVNNEEGSKRIQDPAPTEKLPTPDTPVPQKPPLQVDSKHKPTINILNAGGAKADALRAWQKKQPGSLGGRWIDVMAFLRDPAWHADSLLTAIDFVEQFPEIIEALNGREHLITKVIKDRKTVLNILAGLDGGAEPDLSTPEGIREAAGRAAKNAADLSDESKAFLECKALIDNNGTGILHNESNFAAQVNFGLQKLELATWPGKERQIVFVESGAMNSASPAAPRSAVSPSILLQESGVKPIIYLSEPGSRYALQNQKVKPGSSEKRWYVVDTQQNPQDIDGVHSYPRVTQGNAEDASLLQTQIEALKQTAGGDMDVDPVSGELSFEVNEGNAEKLIPLARLFIAGGSDNTNDLEPVQQALVELQKISDDTNGLQASHAIANGLSRLLAILESYRAVFKDPNQPGYKAFKQAEIDAQHVNKQFANEKYDQAHRNYLSLQRNLEKALRAISAELTVNSSAAPSAAEPVLTTVTPEEKPPEVSAEIKPVETGMEQVSSPATASARQALADLRQIYAETEDDPNLRTQQVRTQKSRQDYINETRNAITRYRAAMADQEIADDQAFVEIERLLDEAELALQGQGQEDNSAGRAEAWRLFNEIRQKLLRIDDIWLEPQLASMQASLQSYRQKIYQRPAGDSSVGAFQRAEAAHQRAEQAVQNNDWAAAQAAHVEMKSALDFLHSIELDVPPASLIGRLEDLQIKINYLRQGFVTNKHITIFVNSAEREAQRSGRFDQSGDMQKAELAYEQALRSIQRALRLYEAILTVRNSPLNVDPNFLSLTRSVKNGLAKLEPAIELYGVIFEDSKQSGRGRYRDACSYLAEAKKYIEEDNTPLAREAYQNAVKALENALQQADIDPAVDLPPFKPAPPPLTKFERGLAALQTDIESLRPAAAENEFTQGRLKQAESLYEVTKQHYYALRKDKADRTYRHAVGTLNNLREAIETLNKMETAPGSAEHAFLRPAAALESGLSELRSAIENYRALFSSPDQLGASTFNVAEKEFQRAEEELQGNHRSKAYDAYLKSVDILRVALLKAGVIAAASGAAQDSMSGGAAAPARSDIARSQRAITPETLLNAPLGTLIGLGDRESRYRLQLQKTAPGSPERRWYVVDTEQKHVIVDDEAVYPRVTIDNAAEPDLLQAQLDAFGAAAGGEMRADLTTGVLSFDVTQANVGKLVAWAMPFTVGASDLSAPALIETEARAETEAAVVNSNQEVVKNTRVDPKIIDITSLRLGTTEHANRGIWELVDKNGKAAWLKRVNKLEYEAALALDAYGRRTPHARLQTVLVIGAYETGLPQEIPLETWQAVENTEIRGTYRTRRNSPYFILMEPIDEPLKKGITYREYLENPLRLGRKMTREEFNLILHNVKEMRNNGIIHGDLAHHKNSRFYIDSEGNYRFYIFDPESDPSISSNSDANFMLSLEGMLEQKQALDDTVAHARVLDAPVGQLVIRLSDEGSRYMLQRQKVTPGSAETRWYVVDTQQPSFIEEELVYPRVTEVNAADPDLLRSEIDSFIKRTGDTAHANPQGGELSLNINEKNAGKLSAWAMPIIMGASGEAVNRESAARPLKVGDIIYPRGTADGLLGDGVTDPSFLVTKIVGDDVYLRELGGEKPRAFIARVGSEVKSLGLKFRIIKENNIIFAAASNEEFDVRTPDYERIREMSMSDYDFPKAGKPGFKWAKGQRDNLGDEEFKRRYPDNEAWQRRLSKQIKMELSTRSEMQNVMGNYFDKAYADALNYENPEQAARTIEDMHEGTRLAMMQNLDLLKAFFIRNTQLMTGEQKQALSDLIAVFETYAGSDYNSENIRLHPNTIFNAVDPGKYLDELAQGKKVFAKEANKALADLKRNKIIILGNGYSGLEEFWHASLASLEIITNGPVKKILLKLHDGGDPKYEEGRGYYTTATYEANLDDAGIKNLIHDLLVKETISRLGISKPLYDSIVARIGGLKFLPEQSSIGSPQTQDNCAIFAFQELIRDFLARQLPPDQAEGIKDIFSHYAQPLEPTANDLPYAKHPARARVAETRSLLGVAQRLNQATADSGEKGAGGYEDADASVTETRPDESFTARRGINLDDLGGRSGEATDAASETLNADKMQKVQAALRELHKLLASGQEQKGKDARTRILQMHAVVQAYRTALDEAGMENSPHHDILSAAEARLEGAEKSSQGLSELNKAKQTLAKINISWPEERLAQDIQQLRKQTGNEEAVKLLQYAEQNLTYAKDHFHNGRLPQSYEAYAAACNLYNQAQAAVAYADADASLREPPQRGEFNVPYKAQTVRSPHGTIGQVAVSTEGRQLLFTEFDIAARRLRNYALNSMSKLTHVQRLRILWLARELSVQAAEILDETKGVRDWPRNKLVISEQPDARSANSYTRRSFNLISLRDEHKNITLHGKTYYAPPLSEAVSSHLEYEAFDNEANDYLAENRRIAGIKDVNAEEFALIARTEDLRYLENNARQTDQNVLYHIHMNADDVLRKINQQAEDFAKQLHDLSAFFLGRDGRKQQLLRIRELINNYRDAMAKLNQPVNEQQLRAAEHCFAEILDLMSSAPKPDSKDAKALTVRINALFAEGRAALRRAVTEAPAIIVAEKTAAEKALESITKNPLRSLTKFDLADMSETEAAQIINEHVAAAGALKAWIVTYLLNARKQTGQSIVGEQELREAEALIPRVLAELATYTEDGGASAEVTIAEINAALVRAFAIIDQEVKADGTQDKSITPMAWDAQDFVRIVQDGNVNRVNLRIGERLFSLRKVRGSWVLYSPDGPGKNFEGRIATPEIIDSLFYNLNVEKVLEEARYNVRTEGGIFVIAVPKLAAPLDKSSLLLQSPAGRFLIPLSEADGPYALQRQSVTPGSVEERWYIVDTRQKQNANSIFYWRVTAKDIENSEQLRAGVEEFAKRAGSAGQTNSETGDVSFTVDESNAAKLAVLATPVLGGGSGEAPALDGGLASGRVRPAAIPVPPGDNSFTPKNAPRSNTGETAGASHIFINPPSPNREIILPRASHGPATITASEGLPVKTETAPVRPLLIGQTGGTVTMGVGGWGPGQMGVNGQTTIRNGGINITGTEAAPALTGGQQTPVIGETTRAGSVNFTFTTPAAPAAASRPNRSRFWETLKPKGHGSSLDSATGFTLSWLGQASGSENLANAGSKIFDVLNVKDVAQSSWQTAQNAGSAPFTTLRPMQGEAVSLTRELSKVRGLERIVPATTRTLAAAEPFAAPISRVGGAFAAVTLTGEAVKDVYDLTAGSAVSDFNEGTAGTGSFAQASDDLFRRKNLLTHGSGAGAAGLSTLHSLGFLTRFALPPVVTAGVFSALALRTLAGDNVDQGQLHAQLYGANAAHAPYAERRAIVSELLARMLAATGWRRGGQSFENIVTNMMKFFRPADYAYVTRNNTFLAELAKAEPNLSMFELSKEERQGNLYAYMRLLEAYGIDVKMDEVKNAGVKFSPSLPADPENLDSFPPAGRPALKFNAEEFANLYMMEANTRIDAAFKDIPALDFVANDKDGRTGALQYAMRISNAAKRDFMDRARIFKQRYIEGVKQQARNGIFIWYQDLEKKIAILQRRHDEISGVNDPNRNTPPSYRWFEGIMYGSSFSAEQKRAAKELYAEHKLAYCHEEQGFLQQVQDALKIINVNDMIGGKIELANVVELSDFININAPQAPNPDEERQAPRDRHPYEGWQRPGAVPSLRPR